MKAYYFSDNKFNSEPFMSDISKSLYERLIDAGCETESWQSDLYVRNTETASQIIHAFEAEGGISNKRNFTSDRDGQSWIELPFSFKPYWDAKSREELASDIAEDTPTTPRM
jgi:hypothetical protein